MQRAAAVAAAAPAATCRRRCAARRVRCAAAPAASEAQQVFQRLADAADVDTAATVAPGAHGNALVATRDVAAGQIVLDMPLHACLVFGRCPDTRRTLRWAAPDAPWPRASAALQEHAQEGLPWDLLAAACMLDALAGAASGGAFWADYAAALLPPTSALPLPLLLRDDALAALQDAEMAANAVAQRQRLEEVLPSLAAAQPSLAYGFALVRSRAFHLGGNTFACVPFVDLANHSARPTAELLVPFGADDTAAEHPPRIRLRARKDLKAGAELTLCYSGESVYTDARLMALHGFVPAEGNRAEKVPLEDGTRLHLGWLQAALGDATWLDMLLGDDARTYAALSSLPTLDDDAYVTDAPTQLAAARRLAAAVEAVQAALPSSVQADEAELASAQRAGDEQLMAAICYRLARKRLWARCGELLATYERWLAADGPSRLSV